MNELITSQEAKTFSDQDADYILEGLRFHVPPLEHQKRCLVWALERRRVAYWLDVGTGKTLLSLYTAAVWGCRKVLVVCPKSVIQTWVDEAEKGLGWQAVALTGRVEERRRKLEVESPLYIINYEGLQWLWGRKDKKRGRFVPALSSMDGLGFDLLIIDETHRVKGRNLTTKLCRELSRRVPRCIVMTGTPLTKDQRDLWGEMSVMDLGESLGRNYYNFLHTHFRLAGFDWVLRQGALEKILSRLSDRTIRYEREACFDLPECVYERRIVSMTAEQRALSEAVITDALDEQALTPSAVLNYGNKLAQIAGGFLITGGEVERLQSNPKLAELLNVLEEIGGKVIVFHRYVTDGRMICEALEAQGISFCSMRGETKDKDKQVDRFLNDPDVKVLVAHPACGGVGLNLQVASTVVFFSNSYSYAYRVQAEGRIYRLGQERKCLFVDLVIDDGSGDSIDHRILRSLRHKSDAADEVLDYITRGGR